MQGIGDDPPPRVICQGSSGIARQPGVSSGCSVSDRTLQRRAQLRSTVDSRPFVCGCPPNPIPLPGWRSASPSNRCPFWKDDGIRSVQSPSRPWLEESRAIINVSSHKDQQDTAIAQRRTHTHHEAIHAFCAYEYHLMTLCVGLTRTVDSLYNTESFRLPRNRDPHHHPTPFPHWPGSVTQTGGV